MKRAPTGTATRRAALALSALLAAPLLAARRAGADTPDGLGASSGLLVFRVEAPGSGGGLLVPSSHAPDARLRRLSSDDALRGARRLLIEAEPAPDSAAAAWSALPPGVPAVPLAAILPPALLDRLDARLRCGGGSLADAARLRPFALFAAAQSPCPTPTPAPTPAPASAPGARADARAGPRTASDTEAPSAETWLGGAAYVLGIPLGGLESVAEAFGALLSVPDAVWLGGLRAVLARPDLAAAAQEEARRAYENGDLDAVRRLTAAMTTPDPAGQAAFDDAVISARNARMVPRLAAVLRRERAVAVLGAAHFPGPDGLVQGLRDAGLRVEPARLRLAR